MEVTSDRGQVTAESDDLLMILEHNSGGLAEADFASYGQTFAGHRGCQYVAAITLKGLFHSLLGFWVGEKNYAATAPCTADFCGQSAVPLRDGSQFFNQGRADAGSVGAAQLPFFTHQPGHFIPVRTRQRLMQGA